MSLLLLFLLLFLFHTLSPLYSSPAPTLSSDIPELRDSLNPSLNPCSDFYQFVCDGFLRRAQPRTDCSEVSSGATRKTQVQAQLEALLVQKPALSSSSSTPSAFHLRQMYAVNDACLQWPQRVMSGSEAVLDRMEYVRGGNGAQMAVFGTEWALRAFPTNAFFQISTALDTRKGRSHPERRVPAVQTKPMITTAQDRLANEQTLASTSPYALIMRSLLEDDLVRALKRRSAPALLPFGIAVIDAEVRRENCESVANCRMSARMARMLEAEAQRRVRSLVQAERVLTASFDANPLYDQSPSGMRNFVQLAQLDSVSPSSSLNWSRFLGSVLAPVRPMVPTSNIYVAGQWPGLIRDINRAIGQLNGQQMSDYLDWQLLWPFLPQMDSRYSRPYVQLMTSKAATNLAEPCPLTKKVMRIEEKCEKFAEWHFPHLLDRVYIQRHGDPAVREDIRHIYDNVYSTFREMIKTNKWLDEASKAKALAKLDALQADLLHFGHIFDEAHLARIYGPYAVLGMTAAFPVLLQQLEGVSLLRRLASNEFYESSWTINAFYSRENNAMVALNAYLQTPIYYGPNYPAPVNFAGVGVVLGHELTHAFDDWGSYYDAEGRLGDWLGTEMRQIFQRKKQCFVEQYGRFPVQVPGSGTMYVNGALTANENIADNGGLAAAFYAWEQYSRANLGREQQHNIRGLEQYTGQQLFFINYAFRNCAKLGSQWLKQRLNTGWHAIGQARVNVPLQNFPEFSRAFNCPRGTPMNPQWMCKIW